MNPKKLPYEEFKRIYSKVPRLTVDLIIKTNEGIVLSKRDIEPKKGYWHFPGGTILFNEKIDQAISRVSQEETGLKIKKEKIISTTEVKPPSVHGHTISIAYLCSVISGKLRGGVHGREIGFFKSIPNKIIKEHKEFLMKHSLLKDV